MFFWCADGRIPYPFHYGITPDIFISTLYVFHLSIVRYPFYPVCCRSWRYGMNYDLSTVSDHALLLEVYQQSRLIFYIALTSLFCTCVLLLVHLRAVSILRYYSLVRGTLYEER
jgi:hypothetical protein